MQYEQRSMKEREGDASFAFWMTVFVADCLFLAIVPTIMAILFMFGVSVQAANGLWIIAGGGVTYVISLGFIIRSLFPKK